MGLTDIMGEVAQAGAALSGLILVFMGATAASFEGYTLAVKNILRPKLRNRIWLAFFGLLVSIFSTAFAIWAKAGGPDIIGLTAVILLLSGAAAVIVAAFQSARDI